ncbi:MAG: 16S rRNA (cytidine(1402)-2'-O)-methyltransferase [Patescibacteria group bacterium]|nr:16S rRNA (cytidine(1402)-2'-O)-methyltransferase [Patescibacteria group bacterium]
MGTLYIMATPIGNLSDITLRALETLKSVDLVACEDTRHSKILLDRCRIEKPLISYHQHSGPVGVEKILAELGAGKAIALVTDAGTPGINDPGGVLVAAAVEAGHTVIPIPGATAFAAALSVSGLPADRFTFLGFLPHKKGRQTLLQYIADTESTVVFYESTHRIIKTMQQLATLLPPERPVVVCRELTKAFETIYRGSATEVLQQLQAGVTKGEFVVIVGPK